MSVAFDKVLMNPPYGGSLHLKILGRVTTENQDAIVVNLSPIRWLKDPSALYKRNSDFNTHYTDVRKRIAALQEVGAVEATSLFGAVFWTDLGIYTLTKDGGLSTEEYWKKNANPTFLKVIENIGKPVFVEKKVPSILSAFGENSNRPYWIKCPRIHGHVGKKDEWDIVAPDVKWSLNVEDYEQKCVYFNTEAEARNFFATLNSPLYKYIKKCLFYSTANVFSGLPWLGDGGYTKPWTDEKLYAHFGLNEEDAKMIEAEIQKISQ